MEIKYNSIRMQNFKCFKDQTIEFGGKTYIKAKNGEGKTTIADAINWVLFGKLANGKISGKIRPHDEDGKDIDMIDIVVTLDMEVDGKPINIVKTQKQNWVKHRGNTEATFEGNDNTYVVNTIPKSEKDYKVYMADLIDEKLFRMTTSANEFLKMKTADKRKILFDLVSDLTDEDVIATDSKFTPIAVELEKYKLDEIISRAKKSISENKKELNEIPARIDTTNSLKSDVDVAELELQKNALKEQISDIDSKLYDASIDDTAEKLGNEIMQMKFKISDYKNAANQELFSKKAELQRSIDNLTSAVAENMRNRTSIGRLIEDLQEKFNEKTKLQSDLVISYRIESEKVFDDSEYHFDEKSTICPTCGREYDPDKISEMKSDFERSKENARTAFETIKKANLLSIEERGTLTKDYLITTKAEIERANTKLESVKTEYAEIVAKKNVEMEELQKLPSEVDLSEDQELASMESALANMNRQYEQLRNTKNPTDDLKNQKSALQEELSAVEKAIASADNTKFDEEIERLTNKQKELAQLIADAEKELDLYEEFNRAKVKMLTDKINQHFKLAKFVMFEQQINGGFKEVCNVTVKGSVLGDGLNTGASVLAQLDIVGTLQRIHNVSVPAIIDNAEALDSESLSSIKEDFQQIYLRVSDDNQMVVERK